MDIKGLIKTNTKFVILMLIVITLGIIGMAYAVTIGNFNPIGVNTTADEINATITFKDSSDDNIISSSNLVPIDDALVSLDAENPRVLKISFDVIGNSNNPENTIFDIAFHDIDIDCELKSDTVKWRLYKEDTMISEGNFSPLFDAMIDDRMVLTETQEDLSVSASNYTLLIWISESCTGDITVCDNSLSQNKFLNKHFNASIKIELSTKSKKNLVRQTSEEVECRYIKTEVPTCSSNLVYNGSNQSLILDSIMNSGVVGTNYTLINSTATNAGNYTVTAKLKPGYKWNDGTYDNKKVSCEIAKKEVSITSSDQTITYGTDISSAPGDVVVSGLILGHSLKSIILYSNIMEVGTGTIYVSNAKIIDENGNDVTSNYDITYSSTGVITINGVS